MESLGNKYLIVSARRYHSFVEHLRKEGKLNETAETAINNLSLEDLIAVKLELSTKTLRSPLYQLPIWNNLEIIVREALIKFAVAVTKTPSEAAASLGINLKTLRKNMKQFHMLDYVSSRWREKQENKQEE